MFKFSAKTWVAKAPSRPTTAPPDTSVALNSTSTNFDYQALHGSKFSSQAMLQNRIQNEIARLTETFPDLPSHTIHQCVAKRYAIQTSIYEGDGSSDHPYAHILDQRPRLHQVPVKKPSPSPPPIQTLSPCPSPPVDKSKPKGYEIGIETEFEDFGGYEMSDCENFDPLTNSSPIRGRLSSRPSPGPSSLRTTFQAGAWGEHGGSPIPRSSNMPSIRNRGLETAPFRRRDVDMYYNSPAPSPTPRARSVSPSLSYGHHRVISRPSEVPFPSSTINTPMSSRPHLQRTDSSSSTSSHASSRAPSRILRTPEFPRSDSPLSIRERAIKEREKEGLPASPRRPRTVSESLQEQEREVRRRRLNQEFAGEVIREQLPPPPRPRRRVPLSYTPNTGISETRRNSLPYNNSGYATDLRHQDQSSPQSSLQNGATLASRMGSGLKRAHPNVKIQLPIYFMH